MQSVKCGCILKEKKSTQQVQKVTKLSCLVWLNSADNHFPGKGKIIRPHKAVFLCWTCACWQVPLLLWSRVAIKTRVETITQFINQAIDSKVYWQQLYWLVYHLSHFLKQNWKVHRFEYMLRLSSAAHLLAHCWSDKTSKQHKSALIVMGIFSHFINQMINDLIEKIINRLIS